MKLSDINKLKNDIKTARIAVAEALTTYKDWQGYLDSQQKEIKSLKMALTTLNNAVLARKAATSYQQDMVQQLSLLLDDLRTSFDALKATKEPDGYRNAIEQVNQLHASNLDKGLIELHAKALLLPFADYTGCIANKERIKNKIKDTESSIAVYKGHISRAFNLVTGDSVKQRNLSQKIERLTVIYDKDATNTKYRDAYTKAVTRLNHLEKQYTVLADSIIASPTIADDVIKQMENAARARLGHIHKKQAKIKAQKEAALKAAWVNGSTCSIDRDVFYKYAGSDHRKTLTIATSKTEKQKAPIGKALHKYR